MICNNFFFSIQRLFLIYSDSFALGKSKLRTMYVYDAHTPAKYYLFFCFAYVTLYGFTESVSNLFHFLRGCLSQIFFPRISLPLCVCISRFQFLSSIIPQRTADYSKFYVMNRQKDSKRGSPREYFLFEF